MRKLMKFGSLALAFTFVVVMLVACGGGTAEGVTNLTATARTVDDVFVGSAAVKVSFKVPASDGLGGGIIRILDEDGEEADSVRCFWVNPSTEPTRFYGLTSSDEITFATDFWVTEIGTYTVEVTLGYGDPADKFEWATKWELGKTVTTTVVVTALADSPS